MERPDYLSDYLFDWELLNVIVGGKSALDSHSFLAPMAGRDEVEEFLIGYGFNPSDPILKSELFGYFQEAIQFIKKHFLKEGHAEGLELRIPPSLFTITDIEDLFLLATGNNKDASYSEGLWSATILKVMHTILHADKDLRSTYFHIIQQQIFDRFYKYIYRNSDDELFLGVKSKGTGIKLVDFETKSKKSRESVIIKLLHKPEHVAEELFDRIGVRFVTHTRVDALRVVKFLQEKNVIMAHNIKPSRSRNFLVELEDFKKYHHKVVKDSMRENKNQIEFVSALEERMVEHQPSMGDRVNSHSFNDYRSIQFTARQLIVYRNPMVSDLSKLKQLARKSEGTELAEKALKLDLSLISRDVRFFYPYEIQIVDETSHQENTLGEASHLEYKETQRLSAMNRLFKDLLKLKGS